VTEKLIEILVGMLLKIQLKGLFFSGRPVDVKMSGLYFIVLHLFILSF